MPTAFTCWRATVLSNERRPCLGSPTPRHILHWRCSDLLFKSVVSNLLLVLQAVATMFGKNAWFWYVKLAKTRFGNNPYQEKPQKNRCCWDHNTQIEYVEIRGREHGYFMTKPIVMRCALNPTAAQGLPTKLGNQIQIHAGESKGKASGYPPSEKPADMCRSIWNKHFMCSICSIWYELAYKLCVSMKLRGFVHSCFQACPLAVSWIAKHVLHHTLLFRKACFILHSSF